jgi:hypothetical protein
VTDDTKKADVDVKVDVTLTGDDDETKQLVSASAQIVTTAYVALMPLKSRLAVKALASLVGHQLHLRSGGDPHIAYAMLAELQREAATNIAAGFALNLPPAELGPVNESKSETTECVPPGVRVN